ncbi:ATP-binding protein [Cutibacterium sp. V947]|uniref:ATP-binding protein n=1 Tax=unclassified Cutibacterium TaxID=2649671 RepID=UPI003EDF79DF
MAPRPVYPFCAIVGQEEMKLALILATISPDLSGVLIRGEKGTAKSTAVRGLAALLPQHREVSGAYHLSPEEYSAHAEELGLPATMPEPRTVQVPVVDLPVGATEDRVTGTLDMETALREGRRRFEPGLLAAAHRAILYVDEVNLLDDHVVDLLLDSAAMGVNTVEREGVSVTHPARFTLVGTMNPEEGELRPQLLDRFGLCVTVGGEDDPEQRIEVIRRRLAFEDDPANFTRKWEQQGHQISERIGHATELVKEVQIDDETLMTVARTCINAHVDGHRADIMMVRAARALAAWEERTTITTENLTQAARLVLPHRMRRRPLESVGGPGAA